MNEELVRLLSVVGPARFLRYRRRFFERGLTAELLRVDPDLTWREACEITAAGRQLVARGWVLDAVALARSGTMTATTGAAPRGAARDSLSDWLVRLGGLVFATFVAMAVW